MGYTPFEFLPLGAIIKSFYVGDINIVQGFTTQEEYEQHNTPFFGETIGRVANRIAGAQLEALNGGQTYALAANNGPNSLHGGVRGWGKRRWAGPQLLGRRPVPALPGGPIAGGETVRYALTSEHLDEGFPGEVEATVTYTTGTQVGEHGGTVNVLGLEYEVKLVGGAQETVVNMTNHSYFNLSKEPTIAGTIVTLSTDSYLPVQDGIPTGGPVPFPGITASQPFTLGATSPDIDDCFITTTEEAASIPLDTRAGPLRLLVAAHHPTSAIHLEVLSTEPAFQLYTGRYIDVPAVGELPARGPRSAFCVEPSRFVNAPNVEAWKPQVLLRPGEVYGARIVYRAWRE